MPSVKQSARVNLDNWRPAEPAPQPAAKDPTPPPAQDPQERSPFMLTSMPLMAATGDAFARQFYTNGSRPQQRILPAKKGAGA